MSKLQKIQKLVAKARDRLASLKPSSALDDLDKIAQERAILREKLELLTDAESAERDSLAAAEAAAKSKQRRALLLNVAEKTEGVEKQHQKLTNRAIELLVELVGVLSQREQVYNREAVGLNAPEILELVTSKENTELLAALGRSADTGVYSGQFSVTWREEVQRIDNRRIRDQLLGLLPPPEPHHTPLTSPRPRLVDTARRMADAKPDNPSKTTTETKPTQKTGYHQVVDLRSGTGN